MEQQKLFIFFSIGGGDEREGFAKRLFPASGEGSLFQFFYIYWEGLSTTISPQTKIPYKLDSFLPTCFDRAIHQYIEFQNLLRILLTKEKKQ